MSPGEIHGLHKQVVDDLKAQLAAAREDARNERTRAEAAEQEKHDAMDDAAELAQSCKELEAKLAAIRAHLKGVDLAADSMAPWPLRELLAAAREALEP